ncbi:hypothetical protein AB0K68_13825 [Streptomyces sp. NPDC050698]
MTPRRPLDAGDPTAVGPYRLPGRLGSGGMGRVCLGRSAGGRTVAVKIVHPHFALDEEFRALAQGALREPAPWDAAVPQPRDGDHSQAPAPLSGPAPAGSPSSWRRPPPSRVTGGCAS